jgi:hypothetical protein
MCKKKEEKKEKIGFGTKLALGALYHRCVCVIIITYRPNFVALRSDVRDLVGLKDVP